jgi:predicted signal transduction protein with EAL and GGDEF domain
MDTATPHQPSGFLGIDFKNLTVAQIIGLITLLSIVAGMLGTMFTFYRDWDAIKASQKTITDKITEINTAISQLDQITARIDALDGRMIKLDTVMEQRIGQALEAARQERTSIREDVVRLQSQIEFVRERIGEVASSQRTGIESFSYPSQSPRRRPRLPPASVQTYDPIDGD